MKETTLKNLKECIIILASVIVIFGFGYFLGYSDSKTEIPYGYEFKLELLDGFYQYYDDTEELLDSIYESDDKFKSIMTKEPYIKYQYSRDKIDSLFNTQL